MSPRTRWLLVPTLALLSQVGCKHHGCKRPDNSCPPPPPPGAPFVAPGPGGYGVPGPGGFGGAPVPAGGDVLMPAPLPGAGGASAAPPPSFPGSPSYFPPVASYYPPGAKPDMTVPPIRLLPPENATPAAGLSESSSVPAASITAPPLPVGIRDFASAIPGRVANGRKPTLDGLDWLRANGYKTALFVHRPDVSDAGDRRQFEQRGLKFTSLDVEPVALSWVTVETFARAIGDPAAQPLFVYDTDGALTGGLWYLYFRRYERLPHESAKLRAGRLGWGERVAEGPHREMAEAAQKLTIQ